MTGGRPSRAPQASTAIADRLERQAAHTLAFIRRAERLFQKSQIKPRDIQRVYTGAYLTFYTQVERAVEDLFIGLLTGQVALVQQHARPLVQLPSRPVARAIVSGSRAYADWLPYDKHTYTRAPTFFVKGRPFRDLSKPDRKVLGDASLIRNAIAHSSHHALEQFEAAFVQGRAVSPAQRRPAGYLRGRHAARQTRMEFHAAELVAVVRRLCA